MAQFLLISLLFLATVAHAQKIDSATARRPALESETILNTSTFPDSLAANGRQASNCNNPVIIVQHDLPDFITVESLLTRGAGVQVTPYSGAPGALSVMRIRGAVGIAGNPQPLYLLDDVPVFQNLGAAQVPAIRSTAATCWWCPTTGASTPT